MELIVSKEDLVGIKHIDIYSKLPRDGRFNLIEFIEKCDNLYWYVSLLIAYCPATQTDSMLEYYKSLKPNYRNVIWLIKYCKFAQTVSMLKFFKSLNPDSNSIECLLNECEFAVGYKSFLFGRTKEIPSFDAVKGELCDIQKYDFYNTLPEYEWLDLIEYVKKYSTPYFAAYLLIMTYRFMQTNEMLDFYKSLNPDYENVSWLIVNCEFAQTKEMLEFYKSLNPSFGDIIVLIRGCEFAEKNKNYLLTK